MKSSFPIVSHLGLPEWYFFPFFSRADTHNFARTCRAASVQTRNRRQHTAELQSVLAGPLQASVKETNILHSLTQSVRGQSHRAWSDLFDDTLMMLKANGITNFELLALRFKNFFGTGQFTFSVEQLILLSDNQLPVDQWVTNNIHRLRLPLDSFGNTALHCLAFAGHIDVLKKLKKQKFNLFVLNAHNEKLAVAAAKSNQLSTLKYFKIKKIYPFLIAKIQNLEFAKKLMRKFKLDFYTLDIFGKCILHYAAMTGNLELIKLGWKDDERTRSMNIEFVECAAERGQQHVVEFFLGKIKFDEISQRRILLAAVKSGNVSLLVLVEDCFKIKLMESIHVMKAAVTSNSREMVRYLVIQRKFNIRITDEYDKTLLFDAAAKAEVSMIRCLVDEFKLPTDTSNQHGSGIQHHMMFNPRVVAVADYVNRQLKLNLLKLNELREGLSHFAVDSSRLNKVARLMPLLLCQLLNLPVRVPGNDIEDLTSEAYPAMTTLVKLIKAFPTESENERYPWRVGGSLSERAIEVLDVYLNTTVTCFFDPYQCRQDVQHIKKRVAELSHPVDLFIYLNHQLVELILRKKFKIESCKDPVVAMLAFVKNQVLKEIWRNRLEMDVEVERSEVSVSLSL